MRHEAVPLNSCIAPKDTEGASGGTQPRVPSGLTEVHSQRLYFYEDHCREDIAAVGPVADNLYRETWNRGRSVHESPAGEPRCLPPLHT